jgi:hypothetical protein
MMPSSMSLRAPARCRSRTLRRCARLFGLSGAYTRNSGLLSYAVAGREDIVRANRGSGRGERKRPDARRGREAEARVLSRDALGRTVQSSQSMRTTHRPGRASRRSASGEPATRLADDMVVRGQTTLTGTRRGSVGTCESAGWSGVKRMQPW